MTETKTNRWSNNNDNASNHREQTKFVTRRRTKKLEKEFEKNK